VERALLKNTKLRGRYLLPAFIVVGVAVLGVLTTGATPGSAATTTSTTAATTTTTAAPATITTVTTPVTVKATATGLVKASKKSAPITYSLPPRSYIGAGEALFASSCASCHGPMAAGTDRAPNLQGLGAATVDFWVSTGRMPLADSYLQPLRKQVRFTPKQVLQIVAYVSSLAPPFQADSGIPTVDLKNANLADGNSLFVLNCAGCHTITGAGDALANGAFAPSLHKATPTQIAEAIRTGPGNMPHFGPGNISEQQAADIVAYVHDVIQHPNNAGGLGLGGIGPVAEGFIGLLIGVGALMLVAFWIGDRA
jgi:ubiquinol-cytochrome c reductase cytochrome c subunit